MEHTRWQRMGSGPKPALLVVEDDPFDRQLIEEALRGFDVACSLVFARDVREAEHIVFSNAWPADRAGAIRAVLVDLQLPGLGGHDLLRKLRDDPRTRYLPVVVFTSSSEPNDLAKSYQLGANSYVVKPFEFARFREVLRRIVSYWLDVNECIPHGTLETTSR